MKSSKSFLLCLLAGLFISANCAALEETSNTTADNAFSSTVHPSIKGDSNNETTTVPSETNSTTDPTTTTTTNKPETTTIVTTTSTSSTTTPVTNTTTTSTTTSSTSTTSTTSTTPSPNTTTTTTPVPSPNTTTTTTPVPSSTTTGIPSTTVAPPVPCRSFVLSSFVGGIVLTLGLLAIGLVAYKFYKARNERNYHTL